MKNLREKTIAALEKQIELLTRDGGISSGKELALQAIPVLRELLIDLVNLP